jgi:hypothetical protein
MRDAGHGFGSLWGGEHVIIATKISSRYPADGKIPATPTRWPITSVAS